MHIKRAPHQRILFLRKALKLPYPWYPVPSVNRCYRPSISSAMLFRRSAAERSIAPSRALPARIPAAAALPKPDQTVSETPTQTTVALSNLELHALLKRRLSLQTLPDDPHTQFSESLSQALTIVSSFFTKLYILEKTPLYNLPNTYPRLAYPLAAITLSQLPPLRLLCLPLIRIIRPLQWILVPFQQMALPLFIHISARYIIKKLTPAPPEGRKILYQVSTRMQSLAENIRNRFDSGLEQIKHKVEEVVDKPLAEILPPPPPFPSLPPPFPSLPTLPTFSFLPGSSINQEPQTVETQNITVASDHSEQSPPKPDIIQPENNPMQIREETVITSPVKALSNRQMQRGLGGLQSVRFSDGLLPRMRVASKTPSLTDADSKPN